MQKFNTSVGCMLLCACEPPAFPTMALFMVVPPGADP